MMRSTPIAYCASCSVDALNGWMGWPHRDAVPLLPALRDGACPACGGSKPLVADQVQWFNYHGAGNTGLPDYWLLRVGDARPKWGSPYHSAGTCPTCGAPSIISEMRFPNGELEYRHNCARCGVQPLFFELA